ncbi:DUF3043 family protein [Frondihabitans sp. PhB188]|uniref:DUF3043 domain-containing protein n=1 Tax=Frondihabitans sp. PhB188 TaxID=2485200 RepID=UPI000FC1EC16|nr:DUF3043 domain-containing protein [Frondihabitans sp. PhB188]ROQ40872.1 DUF3043 family protein [Frondihabitans sp. PhB188]
MAKAPIISPDNSTKKSTESDEPITIGKGRATPTRKEREAANRRPLVPVGKEARKEQRDRVAIERNKARLGLANGEEKYLPARDKGPQRKFVRDYIDARYSVGEIMLPLMVIVIVLSSVPALASIALFAIWGFVLLAVIDCFFVGHRIVRKLEAKHGKEHVERGLRWYAAMRALLIRPMRTPKSQVKRGSFPA